MISRHQPEGTNWSPLSAPSTGAAEKPHKTTFQDEPSEGGEGYASLFLRVGETIPHEEAFFSGCQLTEQTAGETCAVIKSFGGEN